MPRPIPRPRPTDLLHFTVALENAEILFKTKRVAGPGNHTITRVSTSEVWATFGRHDQLMQIGSLNVQEQPTSLLLLGEAAGIPGGPLKGWNCRSCKSRNPPSNRFCGRCGSRR